MTKKKQQKRRPTVSRARARAERASAQIAQERTMQVAREMSRGEWRTERAAVLAAEWGVSESAVRQVAAAASKIVRLLAGDGDEIRANLLLWLERAYGLALDEKDPKAMIAAALGVAKMLGLDAPQKVSLTDTAGKDVPLPTFLVRAAEAGAAELARAISSAGDADESK